jgi:hypothetical protein
MANKHHNRQWKGSQNVMDDEEHAVPLVGFGRCPGMLSVALFLGLPAASAVVLHQ